MQSPHHDNTELAEDMDHELNKALDRIEALERERDELREAFDTIEHNVKMALTRFDTTMQSTSFKAKQTADRAIMAAIARVAK